MKPHFNKRYTMIAKYCVLVMLACVFAVFVFLHFGRFVSFLWGIISILSPILIGAMLAYVFSPLVGFFERLVYHGLDAKKKYRLKRVLSVVSTFVIIITFLVLLILRLIPSVLRGYADLMDMSSFYLNTLKDWLHGLSFGEGHVLNGYVETLIGYVIGLLDSIYGAFGRITPDIASLAGVLVSILGNVILGVILSIYFLFSKEKILAQFKKTARAFLSHRKFGAFCRSVKVTNDKFGGFLKGQLADALIIGTLSYICLSIIGVPYYPLVSVLVGISAFVPLFGLSIGTIIGAVIILLADPLDALWFVIFMICLNLVNKHMIKPKVVRTTVDASSVFMLTAIILMTGIVGFWGLVFGVPVFAVLYAFIHSLVNRKLGKRGLATDSYEYYATEAGKELYLERELKKARRKRLGGHYDETEEIFALHDEEEREEASLPSETEPSTIEFETFHSE